MICSSNDFLFLMENALIFSVQDVPEAADVVADGMHIIQNI